MAYLICDGVITVDDDDVGVWWNKCSSSLWEERCVVRSTNRDLDNVDAIAVMSFACCCDVSDDSALTSLAIVAVSMLMLASLTFK
eukprot:scaffold79330_cov25-Cyclotella_meneghiniana.AAC.1